MIEPSAIPCSSRDERGFLGKIISSWQQCASQFDNETWKLKALEKIPVEKLHKKAEEDLKAQLEDKLGFEDFLVKALLHWFKFEFFVWVNNAPCSACGHADTRGIGATYPNAEDQRFFVGVVEQYQCNKCQAVTRFPRYNHALKLLDTKRGRCGEWAQAFTMCCTALGIPARYVIDWTDHVWTEVYSKKQGRWIHCDSCENAFDAAMMYEAGWGKKLNYVVGFSAHEVVDVTKRYTRKWTEVKSRRTQVSEQWLDNCLSLVNMQLDIFKVPELLSMVEARRAKEKQELNSYVVEHATELRPEELQGRISGSQEWKESRGETGKNKGTCTTLSKFEVFQSAPIGYDQQAAAEVEKKLTPVVNFVHFGDTAVQQKVQVVGKASFQQTALVLTNDATDQVGAAWLKDAVDVTAASIVFQFKVNKQGADGFALVLQKEGPSTIGKGGCDLGYGGITNAFAVEFDTYQNVDSCADPSNNHIAVMSSSHAYPQISANHNISQIACADVLPFRIADGNVHTAKVLFYSNQLFVFVDNLDSPIIGVKMGAVPKGRYYVGFTGSTGGLSEQHSILSWRVNAVASAAAASHIPEADYTFFTIANKAGIEKKMFEFNEKQDAAKRLSPEESDIIKTILNNISTAVLGKKELATLVKMLSWDPKTLFPVLDMLRLLVLSRAPAQQLSNYSTLLKPVLDAFKAVPITYANDMLLYRLFCNLFQHNEQLMMNHYEDLIEFISSRFQAATVQEQSEIKPNLKTSLASFLGNCALMVLKQEQSSKQVDVSEMKIMILSEIVETLKRETKLGQADVDVDSLCKLLVAVGTLLLNQQVPQEADEDSELVQLLNALEFKTEVIDKLPQGNAKLKEIVATVQTLTK